MLGVPLTLCGGDKQPETEADIIEDSFSKDCAIVLKIQGKLAMGIFKEVHPGGWTAVEIS